MNESKSDDLIQEVELEYPLFTISDQRGRIRSGYRDGVRVIWIFTNIELAELYAEQLQMGSMPLSISEDGLRSMLARHPSVEAAVIDCPLESGYLRIMTREELLS